MQPNPKDEGLRWLTQAEDEIQDARTLRDAERFYLSLFLCQQSAEKALKGFLYLHGENPVFQHSVAELLKIAKAIDPDFNVLKAVKRLDDYYIPTRYPNGLPGDVPSRYYTDPDEADRALGWSQEIITLVEQKFKEFDEGKESIE